MRSRIQLWVLLSIGLIAQQQAHAGDLEWRGFFTSGASWTDADQTYLGIITKKAHVTDETYLGLNLSKELDSHWRAAAQFVARGGQYDTAVKADWAFVSYDLPEPYEVTIGKQKIPTWMMSAYLDVGRAYPWVVPPEEVYTIFPLKSFTGLSASYALTMGDILVNLRPYGGDATFETSPRAPASNSQVRGQNMFGAALEISWKKAAWRSSYNQATWDLNLGPGLMFGERTLQIIAHGLRFDHEGFIFYSEFAKTVDEDELDRMKLADQWEAQAATAAAAGDATTASTLGAQAALNRRRVGGTQAGYATVGYQLASFLVHLTAADLKKPIISGHDGDQKSLSLGLNYDINVDSVVKMEAKQIELPNETSIGLFQQRPSDDKVMVYRVGYSMIF